MPNDTPQWVPGYWTQGALKAFTDRLTRLEQEVERMQQSVAQAHAMAAGAQGLANTFAARLAALEARMAQETQNDAAPAYVANSGTGGAL